MVDKVPTEITVTNSSEPPDIQAIIRDVGMELGREYQEWCMEVWDQGATFAVIPSQIPSKGIGMVAARKIKMHEQIVTIPKAIVFTTNSINTEFRKRYARMKVHGLFAFALAYEKHKATERIRKWIKTWPILEDLRATMPTFLDAEYRKPLASSSFDNSKKFCLLPPAIGGIWIDSTGKLETEFSSTCMLAKQEAKMKRDLAIIHSFISERKTDTQSSPPTNDMLVWMWLMVNTRSFYYDMPLKSKPKDNEDKICLCPLVDYFNHAEKGCNVAYNDEGFTVAADRDYEKGEEVVVSYGAHNNDLLWTDYGFLLGQNNSDGICIDAWMLDPCTGIAEPQTRRMLEDAGYWRNYIIGNDGPCYRTEMAIRTQVLTKLQWHCLARGEEILIPEDKLDKDTRGFLRERVLEPCINTSKTAQTGIQAISSQLSPIMSRFALERWKQVQAMAEGCL